MSAPSDHLSRSQSSLLAGLRSDDLLLRGVRRTGSSKKIWEPPPVDEMSVLLPQFRIESLAGRGGMGAVYRAWQPGIERRVALKLLAPTLSDDDLFRDRFRREARMLGRLHHPNIVEIFESGETDDGGLFYAMEYVEGSDVARRVASGPVPWLEAVEILRQVTDALQHAHSAGVVHRDLKPSNILLTDSGLVKIADFGLAAPQDAGVSLALTMTGTALGTLEYAAPEQMEGQTVDHRADIFSLGVIGYELLTGTRPRGAFDPPSVRNPEIDPAFDGVILRALRTEPERRFSSAAEFGEALAHAADRHVQQERKEKVLRAKAARRAKMLAVLLGVMFLTSGSAVYAWLAGREADEKRLRAEKAEKETEEVIQFLLTDLRRRLEKTGNLGAMESVLERAVGHFRKAQEEDSRNPDAAEQLANALAVEAEVLAARGRGEDALGRFSEAVTLTESALAMEPDREQRQLRVVQALKRRSEQFWGLRRYQESLADAQAMLQAAEKLPVSSRPRAKAAAHRAAGDALAYLEQPEARRTAYLTAGELLAAEKRAHPDDEAVAAEYAALDMVLGSMAEDAKDYPLMLRHFTEWHDFVMRTSGLQSAAYSHAALRLGRALILNKRPDDAFEMLGQAVRIAETEVDANPGHRGLLRHLQNCHTAYAEMQDLRGDGPSAAESRRRAAAAEAASVAAPTEEATGPQAPMIERFLQTERELFAALKADPENDSAQSAWATASEDVGRQIGLDEGLAAAMAHYERQMSKLELELASAPPDTWWNLGVSCTLNRLGELKERTRDWSAAEPIFRRSLDLRRRTLAAHPGSAREPRNITSTAARLARTFVALKRPADADALWRELLAELRPIGGSSSVEWRAYLIAGVLETQPALDAKSAGSLTELAHDFLLAHGEASLSSAERESLKALERAAKSHSEKTE